jgi:hypothetical protein
MPSMHVPPFWHGILEQSAGFGGHSRVGTHFLLFPEEEKDWPSGHTQPGTIALMHGRESLRPHVLGHAAFWLKT